MQTEDAGLEIMSGCFGIVALVFLAGSGAIGRLLWKRRPRPDYDRLIHLLTQFATGEDRSLEVAARIEDLLQTKFARHRQYESLTASVAAYAPREAAAFRDEAGLVRIFRAFLKTHGVSVPEEVPDRSIVWFPPRKH